MSELLELIAGVGELLASWRLYVCAIPAICAAVAIGDHVTSTALAWVIAGPIVLAGVGGGWYWEWRAR